MGDRTNIDLCLSKSAEELSGDAGMVDHVIAHSSEDAAVVRHSDHLDLVMVQLGEKLALNGRARESSLDFGDRKADRMLRTGLRDHDDGNTHISQRAKKTIGYARHTHHPGALDVDERHVVDRCKSLDRIATAGLLVDLSSSRRWVEGISFSIAGAIVLG